MNCESFRYAHYSSPIGDLLLVADGRALVGLHLEEEPRRPAPQPNWGSESEFLESVAAQLDAYFAGTLKEFSIPLAPRGTAFQLRTWETLRTIPYGSTTSYGELARKSGRPGAARAVGAANGRNPIAIVVPCHRVIGSNGDPTGYAGGMERKIWLLAHETRFASASPSRQSAVHYAET